MVWDPETEGNITVLPVPVDSLWTPGFLKFNNF